MNDQTRNGEREAELEAALTACLEFNEAIAEALDVDMDETFFRVRVMPGGREVARRSWQEVHDAGRAALSRKDKA